MYAHIERLAILHISKFICTCTFLERTFGLSKTVTPHLRSIGPNVQRHMAYFARDEHYKRLIYVMIVSPWCLTQVARRQDTLANSGV
jgi:hypothetical protein